jgi:hypothetical protein
MSVQLYAMSADIVSNAFSSFMAQPCNDSPQKYCNSIKTKILTSASLSFYNRIGLKGKRFFPFSRKAKMSKFSRNFVSRKFSFPRKFSRKWVRFCDKHFQNDKFKRKFYHFSACPLLLSDLVWSTIRIWQLWSAWWTVLLSDIFAKIRKRKFSFQPYNRDEILRPPGGRVSQTIAFRCKEIGGIMRTNHRRNGIVSIYRIFRQEHNCFSEVSYTI